MIVSTPTTVGPWAKEKLEALGRYLEAYTRVLKNQKQWRTIYADAFAGGGRAVIRSAATPNAPLFETETPGVDEAELINGSPRVALDIDNPFNRYVFIETAPARVAELQVLQTQYKSIRNIVVQPTTAVEGIKWLLEQNISSKTHRGVVFLDPFGAGLDWSLVEALAQTRVFEVIINFPLDMAIARMIPNKAEIPNSWRTRLDSYFGTPAWSAEVYEERLGLFQNDIVKQINYREKLLEFYRIRLKQAFGFVSQPRLIRNTRGNPLYHLLWAGTHKKGLEIADYVLQMGEKEPG
jgi:three-Cys-motif partner protein